MVMQCPPPPSGSSVFYAMLSRLEEISALEH